MAFWSSAWSSLRSVMYLCARAEKNTVFGEHMDDKEFCQLSRGNGVVRRNKDGLFCEAVHHY